MTDKKVTAKPTAPAETPAAKPALTTDSDLIWQEIKDLPIEMFALPNQFVAQYCTPVPVDPTKLYLLLRTSAVLPSLEVSVQKNFTVEMADKWAVVSRKPPVPAHMKR